MGGRLRWKGDIELHLLSFSFFQGGSEEQQTACPLTRSPHPSVRPGKRTKEEDWIKQLDLLPPLRHHPSISNRDLLAAGNVFLTRVLHSDGHT